MNGTEALPEGTVVVMEFSGGNGPLNRYLDQWRVLGWTTVTVTRQSGNRWDLVFRCGL